MGAYGMAANVAGQIMQIAADVAANRKAERTYGQIIGEQGGYRNMAQGALQPLYQSSTAQTATRQMAEGAAQRSAEYSAANARPLATPTIASQVTPQDQAEAALMGQRRANVASQSDWSLRQAMANIKAQEIMNAAINRAQGTSNITPIQIYGALHSKDRLKRGGQFLSSLGSMGMSLGAGGGAEVPYISPQAYSTTPPFAGGNTMSEALPSWGWQPWGPGFNPSGQTGAPYAIR